MEEKEEQEKTEGEIDGKEIGREGRGGREGTEAERNEEEEYGKEERDDGGKDLRNVKGEEGVRWDCYREPNADPSWKMML